MRQSGLLSDVQKHGQKTAYAFMVDADFAVNGTWRLRIAAQRMQQECQHRSIPYCAKAMQIRIYSGNTVFFTTRVFPSQAMGTEDGWQYFYPVHEVHVSLCKEDEDAPALHGTCYTGACTCTPCALGQGRLWILEKPYMLGASPTLHVRTVLP